MVLLCLWLVKLLVVPVSSCLHRYVSSLVTESLSLFLETLMVHFVRVMNFLLHLLLRGNKLIKNLFVFQVTQIEGADLSCLLAFPYLSTVTNTSWNVFIFVERV